MTILQVINSTKPNTLLLTYNATDADIGDNALITYQLGNHQDSFSIDPAMGHIRNDK